MNCRKVQHLLSPYLDEELSPSLRLAVVSHLTRCHRCKENFTTLRRLRLLLLATPRTPVPADFARAWRDRLAREEPSSANRRCLSPFLLPALGTALVGLLVFAVIRWWPTAVPLGLGRLEKAEKDSVTTLPEKSSAPALLSLPTPAESSSTKEDKKSISLSRPKTVAPTSSGERSILLDNSSSSKIPTPEGGREGFWRLWLISIRRPEEVRQVLQAEGFIPIGEGRELSLPFLLKEEKDREALTDLVRRLEEAGARTRLEFVALPENENE